MFRGLRAAAFPKQLKKKYFSFGDKNMMSQNERRLNEAQNHQHGVFFNMADYQKMLEALKILKAYEDHFGIDAQPTLTDLLDRVAASKERMTLTYQKKVFLAVVPIEDVDVIEKLEECIDIADIEDAHQEGGKPIPWEHIEKELGL
jgi:hypothetical protein